MASAPQGHYLVAASQDSFYVRVIGLASMTNSVSLQEVLTDLPRQGFRRFIFDLGLCTGFDSTFMGIVLGVAHAQLDPHLQVAGSPDGITVLMVNAREEHIRLLTEVGLHRVVRVRREPVDFPKLGLQRLEERPADPRSRIRSIIAAHENLVRLGGPNIEKFGMLLETLKREFNEDATAGC